MVVVCVLTELSASSHAQTESRAAGFSAIESQAIQSQHSWYEVDKDGDCAYLGSGFNPATKAESSGMKLVGARKDEGVFWLIYLNPSSLVGTSFATSREFCERVTGIAVEGRSIDRDFKEKRQGR